MKWKAAAKLAGKVKTLIGGIIDVAKSWGKVADGVADAQKAYKAAKASAKATRKSDEGAEAVGKAACSFTGNTRVRLANGKTKPISKIKPGDKVLAKDPQTGKTGARTVTNTWAHIDTVVDLKVAGKTITTTEDHPFWNATDMQWQRADQLDPGDKVQTADGHDLAINGIQWRTARTDLAYNLTVKDLHTYYVGNQAILVHNECPPAALDDTSEAYVRGKHMPGGKDVTPRKSLFNPDADLDELVDRANTCACNGPNANGFFERDVDAGRVIGNLSKTTGALPTTWYRLVQDAYGGVITMHPIPKPFI